MIEEESIEKIAKYISHYYLYYIQCKKLDSILGAMLKANNVYLCKTLGENELSRIANKKNFISLQNCLRVHEKVTEKLNLNGLTITVEYWYRHFCDSLIFTCFCLITLEWIESILKCKPL